MPVIFILFAFIVFFPTDALANEASYWSELIFYIRTQQQLFHREMASAIRAIQNGGIQAVWAMITISFMYGIFHAAGPGHGKAVIGTYLLSHESKLKKGIALSFAAAFVQGLSAVVLVEGLVGLLGLSRADAKEAVPLLEMVSFALISLIGLVLIKRAALALWKRHKAAATHHHHHAVHTHDDAHHHHHETNVCATCGHSHAPDPTLLKPKSGVKDVIAIIFSVGIRPCSGSVLVLIFAELIGLRFAGIASVFAISLGTALTVSTLAFLAIYFRKVALYIAEKQSGSLLENLSLVAAIAGGGFIFAIGLSLLWQASQTSHPLF
jgi:ABC-type nickel/cobalt efflux system permease component RcnA